jgi:hypothetical protein
MASEGARKHGSESGENENGEENGMASININEISENNGNEMASKWRNGISMA